MTKEEIEEKCLGCKYLKEVYKGVPGFCKHPDAEFSLPDRQWGYIQKLKKCPKEA